MPHYASLGLRRSCSLYIILLLERSHIKVCPRPNLTRKCAMRTKPEVKNIPAWLRNFAFFETRAYCRIVEFATMVVCKGKGTNTVYCNSRIFSYALSFRMLRASDVSYAWNFRPAADHCGLSDLLWTFVCILSLFGSCRVRNRRIKNAHEIFWNYSTLLMTSGLNFGVTGKKPHVHVMF